MGGGPCRHRSARDPFTPTPGSRRDPSTACMLGARSSPISVRELGGDDGGHPDGGRGRALRARDEAQDPAHRRRAVRTRPDPPLPRSSPATRSTRRRRCTAARRHSSPIAPTRWCSTSCCRTATRSTCSAAAGDGSRRAGGDPHRPRLDRRRGAHDQGGRRELPHQAGGAGGADDGARARPRHAAHAAPRAGVAARPGRSRRARPIPRHQLRRRGAFSARRRSRSAPTARC